MPSPPLMRRLGALLVLGVVAGAGVRYYIENRARVVAKKRPVRLIDWDQARAVALRVSQWEQAPVRHRAARREQYIDLVQRSEPLIAEYLGVQLPYEINRIYVFDRREWLEANFTSFEQIFQPIEEMYERHNQTHSALALVMGDVNRRIMGAQIGMLLGFLARRVLGQYDLSLLSPDPAVRGALYYVEPNIARIQSQLGLSDEDFRLWIALHETTHVFEFEAYPWVRQHFNTLVYQYFEQLQDQLGMFGGGLGPLVQRITQRRGTNRHWIELVLTPQQQQIFEQLQALMSLVEGYGNHVMNAIGRQLLPSFDRIEQRMEQRQQGKPLIDRLIYKVTGLDLKMAQYQQGEQFVNQIVQSHGIRFASQVWEAPENLPTLDEIRQPQLWIARMGG